MISVNLIAGELSSIVIREITGHILTPDQIKAITKSAVGRYFTDFLPTPESEILAANRVEAARQHVDAATQIILEIKNDLDNQSSQLERIIEEIDAKKDLALHYENLTKTSKESFEAFRKEMEDSIRVELTKKLDEGRTVRRIASGIFWGINLMIGAAVGAYYNSIETFARSFISG